MVYSLYNLILYFFILLNYIMNFQSTTIIIVGVLLVVCLIFIGIGMSKSGAEQWPPIIGECPDYWLDLSGNGAQCVNVKDLGTCNGSVAQGQHLQMDFSVAPYIGESGLCSKYKWASGCGITWDGITEGVNSPCDAAVAPST
jgi:hypothetical protein